MAEKESPNDNDAYEIRKDEQVNTNCHVESEILDGGSKVSSDETVNEADANVACPLNNSTLQKDSTASIDHIVSTELLKDLSCSPCLFTSDSPAISHLPEKSNVQCPKEVFGDENVSAPHTKEEIEVCKDIDSWNPSPGEQNIRDSIEPSKEPICDSSSMLKNLVLNEPETNTDVLSEASSSISSNAINNCNGNVRDEIKDGELKNVLMNVEENTLISESLGEAPEVVPLSTLEINFSESLENVCIPSTPEHQNSHGETAIISELNKVLSKLGFGYRKSEDTGTCISSHHNHPEESSEKVFSEEELGPVIISPKFQDFISSLQYQLSKFKLASEKFHDDHYTEVQGLERLLAQERLRLEQMEASFTQTIAHLKNDLDKKNKLFEAANKDREGMVIKYAMSEKAVITVRKDLETAERRLREANRARDLLSERLKIVQADKEKANNLLETKGQEFGTLNRENQRLKEDLRWTQNKLKTESENKKDADQKIADLIRRLEEARLEVEQSRKDAQLAIKSFQESEENKAVSLDHQLREQHARLILERHERADTELNLKQLQAEADSLKAKQQALIIENNQLSIKVQTLEKERLEGDQRLSRLKQESDKHQQEVADLRGKLVQMESLRAQLQLNEDQLNTCRNEMERLRQSNVELQQDAAACREREAELLDFTQKLTEKNVRLQSEFSALEARAQMLESEQQPLIRRLGDAESKLESVSKELEEEQKKRQEENSLLARHLAESTHRLEQTQQQLEDCQGEIEVLKRKHAASIRELTREIQLSRKRQEMVENSGGGSHHGSNSSTSIAQGSRTSSSSSLNTVCEPSQSATVPTFTFPNGQEPDKHVLIERLVKLQRENAKKAEKLDFMEEHSQVLTAELQKKTRLIQNFVMKMPAGALSSESMDQNKADLAKKTGIMASMYGTKNDETMSVDLSMEINRKLQAVLEDTLLKNITLKENIDTLGAEIARLSSKHVSK